MISSNTVVVKVDPDDPDVHVIEHAAGIIRRGGIVAFPTETVYGLAVNLLDEEAVTRLYRVKRRLSGKPLTVHIASKALIRKMGCVLSEKARRLAEKFWPGPLTLVLRSKSGKNVGFRMPANSVALKLISAARVPVAAPSANLSGRTPPKTAREVMRGLGGKVDLVLDAGRTKVGIESTVVDMSGAAPVILREGAISARRVREALKVACRKT